MEDKNAYLDKILEISKISLEQENERSKQLLTKSDYIIKYISAIFIFVNVFFPLVYTNEFISIKVLIWFYFIVSVPLIIALFFSVRAQVLKPSKFFPTGKEVMEEMKKNIQLLNTLVKLKNRQVLYYSSSTEELQKSNDKRAKIIKGAYASYITSIITLAICILILMIIIA